MATGRWRRLRKAGKAQRRLMLPRFTTVRSTRRQSRRPSGRDRRPTSPLRARRDDNRSHSSRDPNIASLRPSRTGCPPSGCPRTPWRSQGPFPISLSPPAPVSDCPQLPPDRCGGPASGSFTTLESDSASGRNRRHQPVGIEVWIPAGQPGGRLVASDRPGVMASRARPSGLGHAVQ